VRGRRGGEDWEIGRSGGDEGSREAERVSNSVFCLSPVFFSPHLCHPLSPYHPLSSSYPKKGVLLPSWYKL